MELISSEDNDELEEGYVGNDFEVTVALNDDELDEFDKEMLDV